MYQCLHCQTISIMVGTAYRNLRVHNRLGERRAAYMLLQSPPPHQPTQPDPYKKKKKTRTNKCSCLFAEVTPPQLSDRTKCIGGGEEKGWGGHLQNWHQKDTGAAVV